VGHLDVDAKLAQGSEDGGGIRVLEVSLELDQEVVVPPLGGNGPGVNLCEIDVFLLEDAQSVTECAWLAMVDGKHYQGFVVAGGLVALKPNHKESGRVCGLVVDVPVQHHQVIQFCTSFRADCGSIGLLTGNSG